MNFAPGGCGGIYQAWYEEACKVTRMSPAPLRNFLVTHFSDNFLDFSETTVSFSGFDTLGNAPWFTLPLSSLHF